MERCANSESLTAYEREQDKQEKLFEDMETSLINEAYDVIDEILDMVRASSDRFDYERKEVLELILQELRDRL